MINLKEASISLSTISPDLPPPEQYSHPGKQNFSPTNLSAGPMAGEREWWMPSPANARTQARSSVSSFYGALVTAAL